MFYIVLLIVFVGLDVVLGSMMLTKRTRTATYLSMTAFAATAVTGVYLLCVTSRDYFAMSLASSVYFSLVTVEMICLLNYTIAFTSTGKLPVVKWMMRAVYAYAVFDVCCLMTNPFREICLSYAWQAEGLMHYRYVRGALFIMHLGYGYGIVLLMAGLLIYKLRKVPAAYGIRYSAVLVGAIVLAILNMVSAIFADSPLLDISRLFFSIYPFFLFWNEFYYSPSRMLNKAREMALAEMNRPIVLFDFENRFVMCNDDALPLLSALNPDENYTVEQFIKDCNLGDHMQNLEEERSFQCYLQRRGGQSAFRCDYRLLRDHQNYVIGRLFILTDNATQDDLLTGFHTANAFRQYFRNPTEVVRYPACVAVCDLNRLAQINMTYGTQIGDQAIQHLASLMNQCFPQGSFFARMQEATLLAVCPNTTIEQMREIFDEITMKLQDCKVVPVPLDVQHAICQATDKMPDIVQAASTAQSALKLRKMLDHRSAHTSLLDSLIQTQQENDRDTETHVQRTHLLGQQLGRRLGLSDSQLSSLALLCLLHDIGKLGIPLEILNKPGKLTPNEWEVMKSHVEKGYRIARAAPELETIADLILYHHECWDGSGYPDGLKQEAIPLLSRIIAVVDTYDAMTNDRPYRKAMSVHQARTELRRHAGTQFDPGIVAEFLTMLEEMEPEEPSNEGVEDSPLMPMSRVVKPHMMENARIHALPISRYILSGEKQIVEVDDAFQQVTGYTRNEVAEWNLHQRDLLFVDDQESYDALVTEMLNNRNGAFVEHRIRRKDGSEGFVFSAGKRVFDPMSRQMRTEMVLMDVSTTVTLQELLNQGLSSARRSLTHYADRVRHDPLTGILNHEAYQNDVQTYLLSKEKTVVMMQLDVDSFKEYNDTYGHPKGDELVVAVANHLAALVEGEGVAGRMGGDEFSALLTFLPGTTPKEMEERVNHIWTVLNKAVKEFAPDLSLSLGASWAEPGNRSFRWLYREADHALYDAKNRGKNQYVFAHMATPDEVAE